MKKVLLLLITIMLLTGCGKVDKDKLVDDFVDKVESSKAYYLSGKMEIYNGEDTFSYDVEVSYMDDDYYKVRMVNSINSHEQIILKDTEAVYVVTPSLNKSYKFVSEWPYNSSQAYILNTLVKDIESDQGLEFKEEDDPSLFVSFGSSLPVATGAAPPPCFSELEDAPASALTPDLLFSAIT